MSPVFAGLSVKSPIVAVLETDQGLIRCQLTYGRAPHAVTLFVGLATGRAAWREPRTGRVVTKPLYENLDFHRAITDVMIQSGCPVGDSSGNPGYRIEIETKPDDVDELRRPGAIVLARYTPPPNRPDPSPPPVGHVLGSQFAITLANMSHLSGQVSILGHCEDLDTVRRISRIAGNHQGQVRLRKITIANTDLNRVVPSQN